MSHRLHLLALALVFLLQSHSQGQNTPAPVAWGYPGSNASDGILDAGLIPTTNTNGVRYYNINHQGYDIVVYTSGLTGDGLGDLPWDGELCWWFEGGAASKGGGSIPYSTVVFRFYQTTTNIPFGVSGVDFQFQDAEVGERLRAFSYWDAAGSQVALSFTDSSVFTYASGAPNYYKSDDSYDSGSPYAGGTQEGKWIEVNLAPRAISGFTFQAGRYDENYGSMLMTGLGASIVPTSQLLIQSGVDQNVTAGPNFVTTGSNATLDPTDIETSLLLFNTSVVTGSSISQDIVFNQGVSSDSGEALSMVASENIVSATSALVLSSSSGNGGPIDLTSGESVQVSHLESTSLSGTGGSVDIVAAYNIAIQGGVDTGPDGPILGQGGDVTLQAGNNISVDSISTGGGPFSGLSGNISLSASNSIALGSIDDTGLSANPQATLAATYITLGLNAPASSEIDGTLTLQKPAGSTAAAIGITGTLSGFGGLVLDSGTGYSALYSSLTYTGETDVLSGLLAMQGNSLATSNVVLDGSSSLSPGVTTPGGSATVQAFTVGTNAGLDILLSSTTTYDQLQVTGTASLNGVLSVSVANGFTPAFGETFSVLTSATTTGDFATYVGLRLSDRVLEPTLGPLGLVLVTSTVPTGASQPLQNVPAAGLTVSSGSSYDGLTSLLQTPAGNFSATLLDGTASQATTVTMSLAAAGISTAPLQGSLGELLVNLLGTGTDKIVVQLDFNEADALATAGDKRNLFLASTSGTAPFANAVLGNTDLPGEPNNPTEIIGPYDPSADFHLGYYGVDTIDNRVWAVVDYDDYFGLGAENVSATPANAAAATQPAASVLAVSASLNGLVNPNGYITGYLFEYGTDPGLAGASATLPIALGDDSGFFPVTYDATGLNPSTTYYFRVDATTTNGTEYGSILSFTTPTLGSFFGAIDGAYQGVASGNVSLDLSVTAAGAFTGVLHWQNGYTIENIPMHGRFNSMGEFATTIIVGGTPEHVVLHLGFNGSGAVSSSSFLTGTAGNLQLFASHAAYTSGHVAAERGYYTLLLDGTDTSSSVPQAPGYATLTVAKLGGVAISGRLPDGESFSASGILVDGTAANQFYVYAPLTYPAVTTRGSKGLLKGSLTFQKQAGSDLNGTLEWIKPGQRSGSYQSPIDTNLSVIGATYSHPRSSSVLPGFSAGTIELSDTGSLSLSGTGYIDQTVTLTSANILTLSNPVADKLKATIHPATGLFNGSFLYPGQRIPSPFHGVLLQSQTMGAGFFQGPAGTGTVTIKP